MIRSGVDMELFLDLGIVCIHAHIYTSKVADSEALQEEVHEAFKRWNAELKADGRLTLRGDGTVMRDGSLKRETTRHGNGKRR